MPPVLHRQAEAGRHRWARRALRAPLRAPRPEVLNRLSADADRLGPLRASKLRALVRGHWGTEAVEGATPGSLAGGATLIGGGTRRAWVLIDDGDPTSLGPALVWADRMGVGDLAVLVEDTPGAVVDAVAPSAIVARRLAEWSVPPSVWRIRGRLLARAVPALPAPQPPLPPAALRLAGLLAAHGTEPVVEHGVLTGEVLGLEVARAVGGPGGWHLEVGVGRLDREARHEMRPGEPDGAAVDDIVQVVRTWRRPGAPRHPANTLARERWLRAIVVSRPAFAGAATLAPIAPPLPRRGIRMSSSAPAVGTTAEGTPLIVVCSTGVDVDLIPTAADVRSLHVAGSGGGRPGRSDQWCGLVVVVPEGDDYAVTRRLASALDRPAEVRTVPRDWPGLIL